METQYTAYTKSINGRMFYFVKSFQVFPEYSSLGPVLNTFGMHTDFEKACRIAGIPDSTTRRQLFNQIESTSAKVIPLQSEARVYNIKRRHAYPSIFRLIGLG